MFFATSYHISYNVGGLTDIVHHGKNGYLCQPTNISLLAHYMALVAQNNYLRMSLGMHKQDLTSFTQHSMHTNHAELYNNKHI